MILSGRASQALELEKIQIQQQLNGVSIFLGTAQNDLRSLLLHLRPTEVEGKKFGRRDGDDFRELKERSNQLVVFHHNEVSIQKIWKNICFGSSKKLSAIPWNMLETQQMDVFASEGNNFIYGW